MDAAKTVGVCNSLWCDGNNARGHSRGCGQGSCGFMDANKKDVETCGGLPRFFSPPRAARVDLWWHRLWVISVGFDDSASWHQWETLILLETLASPWQPGGHKARLRYDWPSANRYCCRHFGGGGRWGAILPDLSLFVAVKIPLAASPGDWFSPPHPSLTRWPLSLMPALAPGSAGAGGLGPAAPYWFVSSALWRRRNNGDLNVRWWSHLELK